MGLTLLTTPRRVMTPRPASAQLVTAAFAYLDGRVATVADVGPNVEVWATDTSRSACELATANVRRHGLEERVLMRQGDLLEPVPGRLQLHRHAVVLRRGDRGFYRASYGAAAIALAPAVTTQTVTQCFEREDCEARASPSRRDGH